MGPRRWGTIATSVAVLLAVAIVPRSAPADAAEPLSAPIPAHRERLPVGPPYAAVVAGSVLRAALASPATDQPEPAPSVRTPPSPTTPTSTALAAAPEPLTGAEVLQARAAAPPGLHGIPGPVLDAYKHAADLLARSDPACHLDWSLLAAIGRIESGHAADGRVDAHGTTLGKIVGPVLDGSIPGTAVVPDSDHGVLDGDPQGDRAVGPMQFLPRTWAAEAADGNGDGVADPDNVYDAALAAAQYLCAGSDDLRRPEAVAAALFRYNQSAAYGADVVAWAEAYRTGTTPVPARTDPVPPPAPSRPPVPAPPAAPRPLTVLAVPPSAGVTASPATSSPVTTSSPASSAAPAPVSEAATPLAGTPGPAPALLPTSAATLLPTSAPKPVPTSASPSASPSLPAATPLTAVAPLPTLAPALTPLPTLTSPPAPSPPAPSPPSVTPPSVTPTSVTPTSVTPTSVTPTSTSNPPSTLKANPSSSDPARAGTSAPCPTAPVVLDPAQLRVLPNGAGVLVRFTLPGGCAVKSATLRFTAAAAESTRPVQVERVTAAWTATTTAVPTPAGPSVSAPPATAVRSVTVTALLAPGGSGLLLSTSSGLAAAPQLVLTTG